jgi:3-phosphoglycerate kinase
MLREIMVFHVKSALMFAALILIVSSCSTQFYVFGISENDAKDAITEAEKNIVLCYDAVAEADAAGANVTTLMATLNEAGALLSKAELSYKTGDFDSAINFTSQSQDKLNGFVMEAETLTEQAVQEHYWDFLITVGGSTVGTLAVVIGSFVVWRFLKKKYGGGASE